LKRGERGIKEGWMGDGEMMEGGGDEHMV